MACGFSPFTTAAAMPSAIAFVIGTRRDGSRAASHASLRVKAGLPAHGASPGASLRERSGGSSATLLHRRSGFRETYCHHHLPATLPGFARLHHRLGDIVEDFRERLILRLLIGRLRGALLRGAGHQRISSINANPRSGSTSTANTAGTRSISSDTHRRPSARGVRLATVTVEPGATSMRSRHPALRSKSSTRVVMARVTTPLHPRVAFRASTSGLGPGDSPGPSVPAASA